MSRETLHTLLSALDFDDTPLDQFDRLARQPAPGASGGDRGLPDRLRGATSVEGSAPLRAVPSRAGRAVARVQGRGSCPVAPTPGCARWAASGKGPGVAHAVGQGGHRHRIAPGRRVHLRSGHGPLSRTVVRLQRLPQGKAECRVPGCGDVALLRQHEGFRWRRLDVQPSTSAALTPRIWCFPAMGPDRIKPPSQEGNLRMAGRLTSDCCCPGFERSCFRRSRWIAAVRSWRQLDRGGCGVRQ